MSHIICVYSIYFLMLRTFNIVKIIISTTVPCICRRKNVHVRYVCPVNTSRKRKIKPYFRGSVVLHTPKTAELNTGTVSHLVQAYGSYPFEQAQLEETLYSVNLRRYRVAGLHDLPS
jgi:hypothetical protein